MNFALVVLACALSLASCDHRTPGYFWRDFDGRIPDDAYPVGQNRYIGQVLTAKYQVLVPVQVNPTPQYAVYTYEGLFYSTNKDFKIFCTTDKAQFEWIQTNNDDMKDLMLKKHVIRGGFDEDYPLMIGRSLRGGYIGKVTINPVWAGLAYPDDDDVHHLDTQFEVLAYKPL